MPQNIFGREGKYWYLDELRWQQRQNDIVRFSRYHGELSKSYHFF